MSNWNDLKKNISSLSQDDRDEIDLKVKIVGKVVEARKKAGITQAEMGNLTGIKQTFIARFENNHMDPQLTTVLKLLRPLGLTLDVCSPTITEINISNKKYRTTSLVMYGISVFRRASYFMPH